MSTCPAVCNVNLSLSNLSLFWLLLDYCTCRHLQRKPNRSLCCSSSTTIIRGDCTETTPSSAGRQGCGPSPDTKEAKPKKCCFLLLSAVSGERLDNNHFILLLFNRECFTEKQCPLFQEHPASHTHSTLHCIFSFISQGFNHTFLI